MKLGGLALLVTLVGCSGGASDLPPDAMPQPDAREGFSECTIGARSFPSMGWEPVYTASAGGCHLANVHQGGAFVDYASAALQGTTYSLPEGCTAADPVISADLCEVELDVDCKSVTYGDTRMTQAITQVAPAVFTGTAMLLTEDECAGSYTVTHTYQD